MSGPKRIGKKRPALRTLAGLKSYAVEAMELVAKGIITSQDGKNRVDMARNTTEIHVAVEAAKAAGVLIDLEAEPTGLEYERATRHKITRKAGMTAKGPVDVEETAEEYHSPEPPEE